MSQSQPTNGYQPTPSRTIQNLVKNTAQTLLQNYSASNGGALTPEDLFAKALSFGTDCVCTLTSSAASSLDEPSIKKTVEGIVGDVVNIGKEGFTRAAQLGIQIASEKMTQYALSPDVIVETPNTDRILINDDAKYYSFSESSDEDGPIESSTIMSTELFDIEPSNAVDIESSGGIDIEPSKAIDIDIDPSKAIDIDIEPSNAVDVEPSNAVDIKPSKLIDIELPDVLPTESVKKVADRLSSTPTRCGIDALPRRESIVHPPFPTVSFGYGTKRTFDNITAESLAGIFNYMINKKIAFESKVSLAENVSFASGEVRINIMLIGSSQHGKSSTIKNVVGLQDSEISIGNGIESATGELVDYMIEKGGIWLTLTDTVGFYDSENRSEESLIRTIQCIKQRRGTSADFDAIIIVMKLGEVIRSSYNTDMFKRLKKELGSTFIQKIVVVVTFAASIAPPMEFSARYAKEYGSKRVREDPHIKAMMLNEYYIRTAKQWKDFLGNKVPITFIENNLLVLDYDSDDNIVLPNGEPMFHSFYGALMDVVKVEKLLPFYAFIGKERKNCVKKIEVSLNADGVDMAQPIPEVTTDDVDNIQDQRARGIEYCANNIGMQIMAPQIPAVITDTVDIIFETVESMGSFGSIGSIGSIGSGETVGLIEMAGIAAGFPAAVDSTFPPRPKTHQPHRPKSHNTSKAEPDFFSYGAEQLKQFIASKCSIF